jgi:hypothetical protein
MSARSEQIRINHVIRDLLQLRGWYDPDKFSVRLAREVQGYLRRGLPVRAAVRAALRNLSTSFFRANRGAKRTFARELESGLRSVGVTETSTLETLLAFKAYAERQLVEHLKKNESEDEARVLLQTYLEKQGRTYREVGAGGGRSDIFLVDEITRELVEVKIWRGKAYHEDGLVELCRYAAAEGLPRGFYVVFEFFGTDPVTSSRETRSLEGRQVEVVFVHIPLVPPSKVGSARRKRV